MDDIYYKVAHRSQEELDSFKTRYDDFDTSLIPQIFKDALGYDVTGFKQSESWGSSHVVYFVSVKQSSTPLVLRANLGFADSEVVMLVEKMITEKVDELGVPTNIVLYVDVSRKKYPFDFQIQETLEGETLEDGFGGTKEDYDKMSFELGTLIARYSELTFEKFGLFDEDLALQGKLHGTKNTFYDYIITKLDDDIKYLVDEAGVSVKLGDEIRKLFEKFKPVIDVDKGCLVHHDLADHNVFFVENKITGVFDWEACVVGDPILDVSSAPTWSSPYPREEQIISGYKSLKTLPEYFKEKMDIYRLRTILWKTVFCQRCDILTPKRKARLGDALEPFKLSI